MKDRAREWLNENGGEGLDDAAYEERLAEVEEELAAIDAAHDAECERLDVQVMRAWA